MEDWVTRNGFNVVSRDRLRSLSAKSDLKGWAQTLSHLCAIGVTTAMIVLIPASQSYLLIPVLILQGILLNCLYAGQHELSHWTAFSTKGLNDAFGHLFGFLTLNPFYTDRWAHFAHHRATQDPDRDSELIGMTPYTTATYILDLSGLGFWRRRVRSIVRTALGIGLERDYWLTPAELKTVRSEARIYVTLWLVIALLSVLFQSWVAVIFWIGPLLATKAFHQLQNTGEHTCMTHEQNTFRNTRTLTGPPVMRWLFWNMSYHTAHHCFPGTPFHALPQLHAEIVSNLEHPVPTLSYLGAQKEIFARLRQSDRARRAAA